MEDEQVETLISTFESMADQRTVDKVAKFQIEVGDLINSASNTAGGMGENVVVFPEYYSVWRRTMEMVASNEMSFHIDRFADTIRELHSFLDESKGNLSDVEVETE